MDQPELIIDTRRGRVIIRPAGLADASAFTALREEALRDNPTVFGSSYEARENCTLDWALRVLAEDPREVTNFIAEQEGNLIGLTAIRRGRGRKVQHAATLAAVFVRPEWRGLGIIDGLLEACCAWARARQVIIIKLAVVTTNPAAIKAYQRNGFVIFGQDPKVILYEGVYYDEYIMARELEGSVQDER